MTEVEGSVVIDTDLDGDGDSTFDAFNIACFGAGTLIATPTGEVAVETLVAGDLLSTANGQAVPVKWIGYQTVSKNAGLDDWFAPVKVRAGALGESLPHTDLVLTPDHGLVVENIIANAGALVNGTTIVRVPSAEVTDVAVYYHIETEDHDVILANGAPAETYVDNVTRAAFDNYAEYHERFGETQSAMAELSFPRAMSVRQLPARVRTLLAGRETALERTLVRAA